MGIYLPNMEMPKETTLISIGPGGTVEIHRNDDLTWVPLKEKAVPVPEAHGRLGDLDALHNAIATNIIGDRCGEETSVEIAINETIADDLMIIDAQQTIIPASEDEIDEAQRDYQAAADYQQYCETYEQTYDPETGAM